MCSSDLNLEVVLAGLKKGPVKSSRGVVIVPDAFLGELSCDSFDMLVLPGGQPGTNNLLADERVKEIVRQMHGKGNYTAAICAAPCVLSEAGILHDKKVTAYPSTQAKLDAKEVLADERVVVDGNVITGQGAGTSVEFALKLVEVLAGKEKADDIHKAMICR